MMPFRICVSVVFALGAIARAQEGPSRFLDVKGVKIHYMVEGKGEAVVLVHGLHSSIEMNWRVNGVIAELAKTHQVIALDMPGHGRSDKPDKDDAYGVQIVEDVVAILDHLEIKKAHIVGYSLGGMVAGKMLATHPDRVVSAVLGGMGWLKEGSALAGIWDKMPGGGVTPAAFMHGVGKLAISEADLKKVEVPVKVIVGGRDPVKRMYVVPLQGVRKDWPVAEIDGAGHISCVLKKEFRDEIASWVRKNGNG